MPAAPKTIYQFKISLNHIRPKIWRRIQLPGNASFFSFHSAIQDAMGWEDYHLYEFIIGNRNSGSLTIGQADSSRGDILSAHNKKIKDVFSKDNKKALYIYDFGDDWEHDVLFEKTLLPETNVQYPICLDGKRACPPEDCGSYPGYDNLITVMRDPENEEYEEMVEWLGKSYDSENFKPEQVQFRKLKHNSSWVIDVE